jgi:putative transposase
MPYWQLYYHIVWATKDRAPLLTTEIEPLAHELLRRKATALAARVFALDGMTEHVHLIAAVPPKLALATFIGQIKAATATRVNKLTGRDGVLQWQEEYAVFSFDRKRLPNHVAYVEDQKRHHAEATTIPALERITDANTPSLREEAAPYLLDDDQWRHELSDL